MTRYSYVSIELDEYTYLLLCAAAEKQGVPPEEAAAKLLDEQLENSKRPETRKDSQ